MKIIFFLITSLSYIVCYSQGKFDGGNGDGFAVVTITNIALPIEIVHFSAMRNDRTVKANLTIASTESICMLQLERSVTGTNYTTVDSLTAGLPGMQGSQFEFHDANPVAGINYYRMRITKCDGGFVFSKTLLLKTTASQQFIIADGAIQYTIAMNGVLEIINAAGQSVYKTTLNRGAGQLKIPVAGSGIYFLRFDGQPAGKYMIR